MSTVYKPSLPLHSLYWLLGGIAIGICFIASLYYGSMSGASRQAQAEHYMIPLLVIAAFWLGDDALYFLFRKKKDLTIDVSSFTFGNLLYAYSDIVSILEALNIGRITLTMQNGERIKISTNIYPDLIWYESILEKTLPRITSEILQKLDNQETVKFGKRLSMSRTAITVDKKTIPLEKVNAIRSQSNTDGGGSLIIEVEKKKYDIAFHDIENRTSFMSLSSDLLKNS